MDEQLKTRCERAGVWLGYHDLTGQWHATREETARALLSAMGPFDDGPRRFPEWTVVETGVAWEPPVGDNDTWALSLEDGSTREGRGRGSTDALPLGRHRFAAGDETVWIIAAPPALPLPRRQWGVIAPLYGIGNGRLGTYGDLAAAARSVGRQGAGFFGINPVHAGFFPSPEEYSPYAPSHRRRLNAAFLDLEGEEGPDAGDLIDYGVSYAARWTSLEAAALRGAPSPGFEAYLEREGEPLRAFATHQALAERFGPFWNAWPRALQDRRSPEVAAFARDNDGRIRLHAWAQYEADRQLGLARVAAETVGSTLYLDLAVGTHPFGAETWLEPEAFATGVSLGAPPDYFAPDGQVWGLVPMAPQAMVRDGFRIVSEMLGHQLRHGGILRIDHILGFERAFWVPEESGVPGTYVSMPRDALLAVARMEAARVGATIVGEDLGVVPQGLQEALSASGLLGCRLAMFELDHGGRARPAQDYPEAALASFGSHDSATFAGWREGHDIEVRRELGILDDAASHRAREHRRWEVSQLDGVVGGARYEDVVRFLANTPSRLVALQIEDILGMKEQPNVPGTVREHPNWRRTLGISPVTLETHPVMKTARALMRDAGRQEE